MMKNKITFLLLTLIAIVLVSSCTKPTENFTKKTNTTFEFETSKTVEIQLQANASLKGATFQLFDGKPEKGGEFFGQGILDNNGQFKNAYRLGVDVKEIYLKSTYIGLYGDFSIPILNQHANYEFFADEVSKKQSYNKAGNLTTSLTDNQGNIYSYKSSFNTQGVPDNLITPDAVDGSLIANINAALPEGSRVPVATPNYLASGNDVDVHLKDLADIWITFVHEGAGYRNVLGYYTYPTNQPPLSAADIDTTHILFPNTSFSGAGGGLKTGDKIHIGRFPAGTSVGWVLIQNAYNINSGSVQVNNTKLYSNPNFNPEPNANDRQHNVQLYHPQRDLILIGFEDIERNLASCDQDFNDAIFYLTFNPVTAVESGNLPTVTNTQNDQDQDGVSDPSDQYPNDPTKAFDQYYPDAGNFSSLAFEDLWPAWGDYDFNDLVIDQQYKLTTSANQMITNFELKMVVSHIGASYTNGFGIELPIPASNIASVSGSQLNTSLVTLNGKGLEANQSKAVMIAFDDAFAVEGDTIILTVQLSTPYSLALFNQEGVNPFMIVNETRGKEVHLVNHAPTDLANTSFFNLDADRTDATSGIFYRSKDGFPWAIEINKNYRAPTEKTPIQDAYFHFSTWVTSGGSQYADWFSVTDGGYRNLSKLE